MLHEFLAANRTALIARMRANVATTAAPKATEEELANGIPLFLDQVIGRLRLPHAPSRAIDESASRHGRELLDRGFTVAQVVHDYGGISEAVTKLGEETEAPITAADFQAFSRCLGDAIAQAVTEYGHGREQSITEKETARSGELAHELRNLLAAATLACDAITTGKVAPGGSTAALLVRGLTLTVTPVEAAMEVKVDRQLLTVAVANLLQNAFKFSRVRGLVTLKTSAVKDRVLIEVEDECGGLPPGKADDLFQGFEQRGKDRTGLGLGLSISRKSVKADRGEIRVRDRPGVGCVFTIDLPRL
jgi:hypothetical protein